MRFFDGRSGEFGGGVEVRKNKKKKKKRRELEILSFECPRSSVASAWIFLLFPSKAIFICMKPDYELESLQEGDGLRRDRAVLKWLRGAPPLKFSLLNYILSRSLFLSRFLSLTH